MNEQQPSERRVTPAFVSFFEKALDSIKPPLMKFLVVLVVAVLVYLLFKEESVSSELDLVLFVVVVLISAFLAAALQYVEMRLGYSERTGERLKDALREVVMELEVEKTGRTPLNPVKLIEVLDTRFDAEELRSLCVHLCTKYPNRMTHPSLDYDSLKGQGKAAKVRELVLYCQRRGMLDQLASAIRDQRSDVEM